MSDTPTPATLKIESWPLLGLPKGLLDPMWMLPSSKDALQKASPFLLSPALRATLFGPPISTKPFLPLSSTVPVSTPSAASTPVAPSQKAGTVSAASPIHKIVLGGPTSSPFIKGAVVESLRSICALISEQCGRPAKVLNGVIWLSIDSKRLYDNLEDPGISKAERVVQTTELLSSALSVIAAATGAQSLEKASTGVHFVAQFGDSFHKGTLTIRQSDLILLSPERDSAAAAEILKLGEIFIPAG